eukprot:Amastigsp_a340711_63.p3 type:complete len:103 gc:universal Amastigsp_a340711_63:505-813(+)
MQRMHLLQRCHLFVDRLEERADLICMLNPNRRRRRRLLVRCSGGNEPNAVPSAVVVRTMRFARLVERAHLQKPPSQIPSCHGRPEWVPRARAPGKKLHTRVK